jgi:zinc protease
MLDLFDRRQAPLNLAPIQATFPKWEETTLDNGLKIFIYHQHQTPIVNLRLYFRAGSVLDGDQPKVSALMFALLLQGTKSRTAKQIAEETEFFGADIGASGSMDFGNMSLSMMSKHVEDGIKLFADVALNPSFDEAEVEFVRKQSLSRLVFSKTDGARMASDGFTKAVYGDHPYGKPQLGTESGLRALTATDFAAFYRTCLSPDRAFITLAGDVSPQAIEQLSALFGSWKRQKVNLPNLPALSRPPKTKVILIHKEGAVQSTVNMGHLGVKRNDEDFIRLYVMNMILGGYFGSRLNMNLRERQGYTYGISSGFDAHELSGEFVVDTQVRNEVTADAIREILNEIKQLRTTATTVEELKAVKQYITGNFVISNESPSAVANRIATVELYGMPKDYYQKYIDEINAVTLEEVREMAQTYIQPESFYMVVSGDKKIIGESLKAFGDIEVQDADGNVLG